MAAAHDRRLVVDRERLVVHPPVEAPEVGEEAEHARAAEHVRVEQAQLDPGMRVERGEGGVQPRGGVVVEQQPDADAPVGGGAELVEQEAARQVVVPDVILGIDAAFGHSREQRARGERVPRLPQRVEPGQARVGGGYGVVIGGGVYATIRGNVFEYNNHSVAASGKAYSGYLASRNYILEGAIDKKDHHFDVHGTMDPGHWAGGDAGTFFEVDHINMRFRPSFFPFTEPSLEVDIQCRRDKGEIRFGEGEDWLEILGCGMVHPRVLANCGLDAREWQGFAFGIGIERITMLKHGMADLRPFFEADVRWLRHYGSNPLAPATLHEGV